MPQPFHYKGREDIAAVLLTVLLLCLCPARQASALGEAAGTLTACSSLDDISRHGNVVLMTDRRLLLADLVEAGIEPGDTVNVSFLDQSMDVPVTYNFSDAPSGAVLLRIKDDAVELVTNMGEFASEYFADKSTADGGTVTWTYKDGIEDLVAFKIALVSNGDAHEEGGGVQPAYTDARSDYPNLSDASFANFRAIATTGMGEGALYMTSSPIDPAMPETPSRTKRCGWPASKPS